jgi:hypothetical protein
MRSRKHLKSSGVEKQVVVNVIELIENRHKNPFYDEPVKRKKKCEESAILRQLTMSNLLQNYEQSVVHLLT